MLHNHFKLVRFACILYVSYVIFHKQVLVRFCRSSYKHERTMKITRHIGRVVINGSFVWAVYIIGFEN